MTSHRKAFWGGGTGPQGRACLFCPTSGSGLLPRAPPLCPEPPQGPHVLLPPSLGQRMLISKHFLASVSGCWVIGKQLIKVINAAIKARTTWSWVPGKLPPPALPLPSFPTGLMDATLPPRPTRVYPGTGKLGCRGPPQLLPISLTGSWGWRMQ